MKGFKLNVCRTFANSKDRREYFTFNNGERDYELTDRQMTEFEDSIIMKIVKKIKHYMRNSK